MKNQLLMRKTPAYEKFAEKMLLNKNKYKEVPSSVIERLPEMINPPAGYEEEENFPNCCTWHKSVSKNFEQKWKDFPDCCEHHKKLKTQDWFDKNSYTNLGEESFLKISYTVFHIENVQDNEDGLEDSLEYIYYVVWSFGQVPDDFGAPILLSDYVSSLLNYLKQAKSRIVYRDEIIKYLEEELSNTKPLEDFSPTNTFDLNILHEKYNEWFSIFPFELSIFSQYKEHFKSIFPILDQNDIKYNRYLNISMARVLSKNELVSYLVKLSNNLLYHINAYMLYNKGIFSGQSNYELELIQKNRSLELSEIILHEDDSKTEYIKILKKWIAGERKYMGEIKEFFHSDNAFLFHKEIDHLFDPNSIAYQNKIKKNIKIIITDENFEIYKRLISKIKIGDEVSILPEPKDFEDAWNMFVDIDAQYALEAYQRDYFKKYNRLDNKFIDIEIKDINDFIDEANSIFDSTTFRENNNIDHSNDKVNYLRLTNGFFSTRFVPLSNGNLSGVYGRFVLYKDWLLDEKNKLNGISLKTPFVKKELNSFATITLKGNWKELLLFLSTVETPLIDENLNYIGRARHDKGVICSWVVTLQNKGYFSKEVSRQQLALLLNKTITNFNIGSDGKTFSNISQLYEDKYKEELISLLP